MNIDVVMCTYNSCKSWFKRCLLSIKREVPICHLIVIDNYSHDDTVHIIKSIFPNAIIIKTKARLAHARRVGIKNVDTDLFAFIDDDVELTSGWFIKLTSMLGNDVGAIHGLHANTNLTYAAAYFYWNLKRLRRAYLGGIIDITSKNLNIFRGYITNTILMTDAAVSWNPPLWLTAYEDHHLLRHIVAQGYRWRILLDLTAKHYTPRSMYEAFKRSRWNSAGARMIKFGSNSVYKSVAKNILKSVVMSISMNNPLVIPYVVVIEAGRLQGYLYPVKYLYMYR